MVVTLSGMIMDVIDVQSENALQLMVTIFLEIIIDVALEQKENTPLPMEVTLSGIVIDFKPEHLANA
jgi:hypothetical protein